MSIDREAIRAGPGNDTTADFDDGSHMIDVGALGVTDTTGQGVTDNGDSYDIDLGGGNTIHVVFDDSSPSTVLTEADFIFA